MHIRRPSWYEGNIPWLLAARATRSFSQSLLVVVVPLYVAAAHYSALQVGYLLSIAMIGSTGMTLLVGVLSDRFGRKLILIVVAATGAIGAAAFAFTTQFWVLAVMSALASIRGGGAGSGGGFGPFYPAEQALIAGSSSNKDRNAVFSSLSLVGVIAAAAGSAVAALPGILHGHFSMSAIDSYHPVFWIAALTGLSVALLSLPLREKPPAPRPTIVKKADTSISTWGLIGRLWLTNGINGLVMGIVGPFLTYWFALRYGVGTTQIATLYTLVNLLTAFSYIFAPRIAASMGAVRAIVFTRLGSVVLMAGMAIAPTFFVASAAYALRVMVNSIGMPIRQSFVMGIADERSRSRVAAVGNLPAQAIGMASPTLASYLIQAVSEEAPVWLATIALAINAGLFALLFRDVKPPEEQESKEIQMPALTEAISGDGVISESERT